MEYLICEKMAWIGFNWMKLLENLLKEIEDEREREMADGIASCNAMLHVEQLQQLWTGNCLHVVSQVFVN